MFKLAKNKTKPSLNSLEVYYLKSMTHPLRIARLLLFSGAEAHKNYHNTITLFPKTAIVQR